MPKNQDDRKAHATPWMKFYPRDWTSDVLLRTCSIGARGLWLEMICFMHGAEPYGHLAVHGEPVTKDQLALIAGVPRKELTALLNELRKARVFDEENGVIFSRRMVRDYARSEEGRGHASKRWGKQDQQLAPEAHADLPGWPIAHPNGSATGDSRARPSRHQTPEIQNRTPDGVLFPPSPDGDGPPLGKTGQADAAVEAAVEAWNQLASRVPRISAVSRLSASRRSKLKARLKEAGLDGWRAALEKIEANPFLRGEEGDRLWAADFDFAVSESKFLRIMEGYYDRQGPVTNGSRATLADRYARGERVPYIP
jgi:hypothetical protein